VGGAASRPARHQGRLMPISNLHRLVAATVLRVAASRGFALGGGNALIAHGVVDRLTNDVDVFTDEEDRVEAAAGAVETALRAAGFETERKDKTGGLGDIFEGMGAGLAEWSSRLRTADRQCCSSPILIARWRP
jgi:hypothetical protein